MNPIKEFGQNLNGIVQDILTPVNNNPNAANELWHIRFNFGRIIFGSIMITISAISALNLLYKIPKILSKIEEIPTDSREMRQSIVIICAFAVGAILIAMPFIIRLVFNKTSEIRHFPRRQIQLEQNRNYLRIHHEEYGNDLKDAIVASQTTIRRSYYTKNANSTIVIKENI